MWSRIDKRPDRISKRYFCSKTELHNNNAEIDQLLKKFDIVDKEACYNLTIIDLYDKGASTSLLEKLWKFKDQTIDREFWNQKNTREYLDHLAHQLKVGNVREWLRVKGDRIERSNAYTSLIQRFGSLANALGAAYPEFVEYHKDFFESVAKDVGVNAPEDWLRVTTTQVKSKGGGDILQHHGSLTKGTSGRYYANNSALSFTYPDINWDTPRMHTGYWKKIENQRSFLDQVARDMDIVSVQDWYNVKVSDIIDRGGRGLLHHYKNSLASALSTVYPEYQTIKRTFFDSIAKELNVSTPEDWQNVTPAQVNNRGGLAILRQHSGSLEKALESVYPYLFHRSQIVTKGFWSDIKNQREFFNQVAKELGIKTANDWYKVTTSHIAKKGGAAILARYDGSLVRALRTVYPGYQWRSWSFFKPHLRVKNMPEDSRTIASKSQMELYSTLKKLFPSDSIVSNYSHPDLTFKTRRHMELDLFIPSLSIAFEYQGAQHYGSIGIGAVSAVSIQRRDSDKREAAKALGITLVEVPYWWDRSHFSLQATIRSVRPDLVDYEDIVHSIPTKVNIALGTAFIYQI